MKKVVVTGASGFLGRHCLPLLAQCADEVIGLVHRRELAVSAGVRLCRLNLLDPAAVSEFFQAEQPTHLLHLAWIATPKVYWTSPDNLRWVQASLHLFDAFAHAGGRRAVTAGTCAEYDGRYGFCSEELTPCQPSTLYGTCKHALHAMLKEYGRLCGVSAAWGRIFFLYGPYEYPERLVSSVILSLLHGKPARCSHGEQIRDFLEVSDVAAAFVALLASSVEGAVNVASGLPVALKDVVGTVADLLRARSLIQLGAIPATPGEAPVILADTRRLATEVGWHARQSLPEGLARTIDWWRRSLQG